VCEKEKSLADGFCHQVGFDSDYLPGHKALNKVFPHKLSFALSSRFNLYELGLVSDLAKGGFVPYNENDFSKVPLIFHSYESSLPILHCSEDFVEGLLLLWNSLGIVEIHEGTLKQVVEEG
jgi:hypothetical protein